MIKIETLGIHNGEIQKTHLVDVPEKTGVHTTDIGDICVVAGSISRKKPDQQKFVFKGPGVGRGDEGHQRRVVKLLTSEGSSAVHFVAGSEKRLIFSRTGAV
ncbi:hypothetical protein M1307_03315 [Patescibacteria group bacterium]|nr:hypothetical protein [Patescibacteria group bacterium]